MRPHRRSGEGLKGPPRDSESGGIRLRTTLRARALLLASLALLPVALPPAGADATFEPGTLPVAITKAAAAHGYYRTTLFGGDDGALRDEILETYDGLALEPSAAVLPTPRKGMGA